MQCCWSGSDFSEDCTKERLATYDALCLNRGKMRCNNLQTKQLHIQQGGVLALCTSGMLDAVEYSCSARAYSGT